MNTEQNLENINETQYVDGMGNPIDPSTIDTGSNNIGETQDVQTLSLDQTSVANDLNAASGIDTELVTGVEANPIHTSEHQMDDKEMFSGMVTFDYNNVPITDIVNSIILDAINKGASDIHFDPFDEGIKIRIRIDGQLNDYSIVPLYVKKNMITRIKIISGMNITESRTPQDGAIRTELANKTIDLRVSCLPTNLGEKIVIRIMDYSMSAAGVEGLDFNKENLEKVNKMLALPNGIILVTGATGSGKSTTVYSMLQVINNENTNIVTVEDPIEMNIGGINQVQAVAEIGLDFATVLRSILRQDPDVIMIGEIRDEETAKIAVRASITGHLVLSTIHTNNSLNTIERLTDMNVERYLLGSALSGVISQKLSRRLCEKCKRKRPTNEYEKEMFKNLLEKDVDEIYEPVGCPECSKGYRGRIAIQEVLLLNQHIKDAIIKGATKDYLRKLVYSENGTMTMLEDGLNKVLEGKTSFEEILKLIDLDDDLGTGTELGLEDQMEAAQMNNFGYGYGAPQYGAPANLSGPININLTPDLLAGLQGLQAATPQVVKPIIVSADDLDDDDDELDEETEKTILKKLKRRKKKNKKRKEEVEEIEIIDDEIENVPDETDDAIEDLDDIIDEAENINTDDEIDEIIDVEEPTEEVEEILDNDEIQDELEEIVIDDSISEESLNDEIEHNEQSIIDTNEDEVVEESNSEDDEVLDLLLNDEEDEDIDELLENLTNEGVIDDISNDDSLDKELNNLTDEELDAALDEINSDDEDIDEETEDENKDKEADDEEIIDEDISLEDVDDIINDSYDSIDDDFLDDLLDGLTNEDED